MTFKSTLACNLIALVVLALSSAGCAAGDDCNIAAAHVVECLEPAGSPAVTSPGPAAKCDGANACRAACVNRADCDALDAFLNGNTPSDPKAAATATAGAEAYAECLKRCTTP